MRIQWYYKIYDEAIKGLRQTSPENIHGSLLTIGELLRSTGDFLGTRFKEICDWVRKSDPYYFIIYFNLLTLASAFQVLKFKDHKDPLVRKTTISLVPVLAGFNPQAFMLSHLQPCASHMLTVMKKEKGAERSAAFLGTF
jgi:FKBP12-rapamycin complex-associated protein